MAATAPIDIQIRTKGLSDLQKLEKRMEALERDVTKLNKTLPKTSNAIKSTGRAAATATGNIQRMGVAFRTTLGPIVALYGGLNFLNKSLQVASQRQVNVAKLTNGLKNLGATQADLESLAAAADKFGRATLFDQEDATNAFALLTSFQRIGVDSYERVTKAAGDLATVTGQDLKGAMTQLSKALEDPAKRVTDLARSGTVFTDQQKEQIKVLQESGRLFEAQNLILSEIEKQYGGAAEAAGSAGLAGAMDTLGEATRDFQEALVQTTGAITAAESAISILASSIDKLTEAVKLVGGVLEALDVALKNVTGGIVGLPGAIDAASQGFINQFPILQTVLAYYTKIAEAMGQYAADSKGGRNFGTNYASQEKDLFKAAGGWTPYGRKETPELPKAPNTTKSGGGAGAKGPDRVKMGNELIEQQRRRLELLYAESDLEKALLKIENDRADALKKVADIAPDMQGQAMANINEIFDAEKGLAIGEALAKDIQDTIALTEAREDALQPLEDQRELLEATLKGNAEEVKLRQQARDIAKDIAGLSEGEVFGILQQNQALEQQVQTLEEMKQMAAELSGVIANGLVDGLKGVVQGTQSAEEAMKKMIDNIADLFLQRAADMIAKAIQAQVFNLITGLLPGGSMAAAAGGMFGSGASAPIANIPFSAGGISYEGGGYTGDGARTGGIDGRGGFPAILHPNETVVDHRAAMNRWNDGERDSAPSTSINMSFQTTKFMDREWVDREQLEGALAQTRKEATAAGAKAGETRVYASLRNSRSRRSRLGM